MDRPKPKRAARRAQVTRIVNEVIDLRQNLSVNRTTLNGLLARLEVADRELRKVNEEIEVYIKEDELATEYETMFSYEEQAANAMAEVQTRLADLHSVEQQVTSVTSEALLPATPRASEQAPAGVKLPKLQLMTYGGELTQWQMFWEQFRTAVHDNRRLNKTEKFQYLTTLLKGRAAAAIRGLQATASNYDDAIEILVQRFGDTYQIEREYLAKLRTLPGVKSRRDPSGLRRLYDHVQANVRGLKALGVMTSSYAPMLADILLSAIPSEMVVEYHRTVRYGTTALRDTTAVQSATATPEAQVATAEGGTDELTKVLNFIAIEDQSTNRCTRRGHRSRYCRAKVTCSSCGSRHVAVVCDPSRSQPGRASDAVVMTSVMAVSNQIISNKDKRPHDTEVLLQTFRAWASSDTACTQLRGVVDGGSQKTFIREDIAQKLKLQVVGEAKLHIHTFANQATTTKVHLGRVVEVHLRSQYSPLDYVIRAVTIPFICQDLPEVPTTQQFVELLRREGHLIADDVLFPSVNCEAGIGLLVGSDELWRLLTGDVKRDKQDDRLVAIDTVFGWTFQGPSRLGSECTERSTTAVCVLRMGCTAEEQDVIKKLLGVG
ncbi:uncharacterized protein LOC135389185 [Ornithodoros turicata]|uniref:uncharacterized protein LOC135389185 n=1 Tax=Ornithodoros turicata TaxID=34597 RepID=UPI0031395EFA